VFFVLFVSFVVKIELRPAALCQGNFRIGRETRRTQVYPFLKSAALPGARMSHAPTMKNSTPLAR
jgi:hypothetical protein